MLKDEEVSCLYLVEMMITITHYNTEKFESSVSNEIWKMIEDLSKNKNAKVAGMAQFAIDFFKDGNNKKPQVPLRNNKMLSYKGPRQIIYGKY